MPVPEEEASSIRNDQGHAENEKGCAREPDWICRMLENTEQAKMLESQ
jgi:hypothetical protein